MRLFVLFFIFSCFVYSQDFRPYLQVPTENSIWISWKTSENTETKVFYGLSEDALTDSVIGETKILSDVGYPNNYYYHYAKLTELQPNTAYYYKAVTGEFTSEIHRFVTHQPKGDKLGKFRFIILGDHQIKNQPRYEKLVEAAKEMAELKWGNPIEDYVRMIMNDGDQVDLGNLDHYENIHFKKSNLVSPNIPIMTAVGNHETYGTLGMQAYYDHFFYDDLKYQGISSPGGEDYYAYQTGPVLFIVLSSEHTGAIQLAWVQNIINKAKDDESVDWIFTVGHRPIQAESYVGDISPWIRNEVMPIVSETEKHVMFIGGHHHLYARGQLRDSPAYHIISGGAAWDQYWGQSTEQDFDDVQKTIDYWAYQLVELDLENREMQVDCYAIGSPKLGFTLDNEHIDSFHRKFGKSAPNKPSVTNIISDTLTLPYTFYSSEYSTSTDEVYNSTYFQISSVSDFSIIEYYKLRDFENLYGTTGSPNFDPVDINEGINIFELELPENSVVNGKHYIRVKHRDKNLEWSEWSDPVEFDIKGSINGPSSISVGKKNYDFDEAIEIVYENGPGNPTDWIGIYKRGQIPGSVQSISWDYVSGAAGTLTLSIPSGSASGEYYAAFFENDSYNELCERISIYAGKVPLVNADSIIYSENSPINISFKNAPNLSNDWIGIYKSLDIPGVQYSTLWEYVSSFMQGDSGSIQFNGLDKGYYFANYFIEDLYFEPGERVYFQVGEKIGTVTTDKEQYNLGEDITVYFQDGPGTPKDWMGIYEKGSDPQIDYLVAYLYVDGNTSGSVTFNEENLPEEGEYFTALFTNDTYTEVSNRKYFTVGNPTSVKSSISGLPDTYTLKNYPNPFNPSTTIQFALPEAATVKLSIFDVLGREVNVENYGLLAAGYYNHFFDASYLSSGVYFYSIKIENKSGRNFYLTEKMILIK